METRKLTPKQQAFANATISGKNPSEAYRAAGYSCVKMSSTSIAREAQKLLKNPSIAPIIGEGVRKAADKAVWTREKSIETYAEIVDTGMSHIRKSSTRKNDEGKDTGYFNINAASGVLQAASRLDSICRIEDVPTDNKAIIIDGITDEMIEAYEASHE